MRSSIELHERSVGPDRPGSPDARPTLPVGSGDCPSAAAENSRMGAWRHSTTLVTIINTNNAPQRCCHGLRCECCRRRGCRARSPVNEDATQVMLQQYSCLHRRAASIRKSCTQHHLSWCSCQPAAFSDFCVRPLLSRSRLYRRRPRHRLRSIVVVMDPRGCLLGCWRSSHVRPFHFQPEP